jgi:p-cumate 2,3-dioxygenase subunit beta
MTTFDQTGNLAVTRDEIEDFLYLEAELLDAWALDEWLSLYTADAKYQVPANDARLAPNDNATYLVDDNRHLLEARVERLKTRRAHREYPHSRTHHSVTNIRIAASAGTEIEVSALFSVWRFRNEVRSQFEGRYRFQLTSTDHGLRIRRKQVLMDMESLGISTDVAIIL